MKILITSAFLIAFLASCSLTSTTLIKPNDSFILGKNAHGRFSVKLKNLSENDLTIWKVPMDGGQHSPTKVQPNETLKVKVERNTGLKIENNNEAEANVFLVVKGDTGLSMGYQNK